MPRKLVKNDIDNLLRTFSLFQNHKSIKAMKGGSKLNDELDLIRDKLTKLDELQIQKNIGTRIEPKFSFDIIINASIKEHIRKCYETYNFLQILPYIYEKLKNEYDIDKKFKIIVIAHTLFNMDILSVDDKDISDALTVLYDASLHGYYKLSELFMTDNQNISSHIYHLLSIEDGKIVYLSSQKQLVNEYKVFVDNVIDELSRLQ